MGVSQSLILIGSPSWQIISQPQILDYVLVRNTKSFELGELYSLKIHSLEYQIDLYSWRKHTHCPHIVSIHGVSVGKNKLEFCGEMMQMRVITEHLDTRLNNVHLLEHQEVVKVIVSCIEAFKVLTKKFGFFRVSPKLIGFTKNGDVKVWINSNFSLNIVEEEIVNKGDRLNKDKLQNFMVEQLLAQIRLKAVDVRKVDQIKESISRQGIRQFDHFLRFINKQSMDLRKTIGSPQRIWTQKKIREQIIGSQNKVSQVIPLSFNTPIPIHGTPVPARDKVISTSKLQYHQSPPPRVIAKPIQRKPVKYFNSPEQLRYSSPKPLNRFLNRVKSQQKLLFPPPLPVPPIQATVPNFRSKPFNYSSPIQTQKALTASTLNQTNVMNKFLHNPVPNRPIQRKAFPMSYNKYKQRARIISDFGSRDSQGIIIPVDDNSLGTTTSRDQKPDDYVQIVGNP